MTGRSHINDENLNSFINQTFIDQKSQHEQLIVQHPANNSFEKQGLRLLLLNKDLNGIVVADKNKIK